MTHHDDGGGAAIDHDPRSIADLTPGSHLFVPFTSRDELVQGMTQCILAAQQHGHRCLLSLDPFDWTAVRARLPVSASVDRMLSEGDLRVLTDRSLFLQDGAFAPDRFCDIVRDASHQARQEGNETLWLANDMAWATGSRDHADASQGVEVWAEDHLEAEGGVALCFYHRPAFPDAVIERALELHTHVCQEGVVLPNPFHARDKDEPTSRLDRMMAELKRTITEARRLRDTVAEARKAQEELRASEERFRQLAEHIADVFWIHSPGSREVEYVSPAYRRIWGRDPEQLYRNPADWMEAVHPADRASALVLFTSSGEGEKDAEYRVVRPDGQVRWIQDRAFPVTDDEGRLCRVVGVAKDITEQKDAEERLVVLSGEISDVIYILDPDGTVRYVSGSVDRAAGYTQEEFQGMNALELVHPEDRGRVKAQLTKILQRPDALARAEYRILDRAGEVRHVESLARNLLDRAGVEGILITSRDVTERVHLEEALQQSQRIEAVGRLAGGIAHDFNNLLTVIRSETDLLLLELDPADPAAAEVEVIQHAADRAATLTNQLLSFSRGQLLRPRSVDLGEVVSNLATLVDRVIGENVQVILDRGRDLPPIQVDAGQLEQVVLNLAVNARDAMPDGGTLTLSTSVETVEDGSERGWFMKGATYTVLRVTDTGMGMDAAVRERIFEPFFTTKSEQGGTGLGLPMAYGFVKQSGGYIDVESTPGQGTTLALFFPAADGVESEAAVTAPDQVSRGSTLGTILVVEDDPAVRRVTTRILEKAGLQVLRAQDAETGLEILAEHPAVDAILTDLGLPGMGGRALVERVLSQERDIPVIVMSGYAVGSGGSHKDLPEEVPLVQKPFTPETMLRTVKKVLEGRPPPTP